MGNHYDYTMLVGGAISPSWKMMEWKSMGFGWHPFSMKWKIIHSCLKPPTRWDMQLCIQPTISNATRSPWLFEGGGISNPWKPGTGFWHQLDKHPGFTRFGIFLGVTVLYANSPAWNLLGSRCYMVFLNRCYPLVNKHSYWKSPFLMGKLTMNGHFQ